MTPVPQIEAAMQAYAASDRALDLYQAASRFYRGLGLSPEIEVALEWEWMRGYSPEVAA